ncbi:MAG: alanine racemase, partial [Candidatus Thorarchaeota archaeon]
LEVLLKVHCGYYRTGVDPKDPTSIKLAKKIENSKKLDFKGILTHAGHSYDATSIEQIREIAIQEQTVMIDFSEQLEKESSDLKPEVVSIGSTPTVELTESFMEGITEIRPGSYVFHDYTQVALGCCQVSDCALTTYSKVIGKYEDYLVTDAGATALSKDLGPEHIETKTSFGKIYSNYENQELDANLHLYGLSQEHGKVKFLNPSDAQHFKVNDALRILPNHSCLTANLHDCYYIVKDGQIIDKWRVRRDRPITSPC